MLSVSVVLIGPTYHSNPVKRTVRWEGMRPQGRLPFTRKGACAVTTHLAAMMHGIIGSVDVKLDGSASSWLLPVQHTHFSV